jgi:predicted RecB family nuclease
MRLTPSDVYTRYRPSKCDLRVYLKAHGAISAQPSPYEKVLRVLGLRHEQRHLATLAEVEDLSGIQDAPELVERTKAAVAAGAPAIYQAMLRTILTIDGVECEVSGRPDFLVKDGDRYKIRDAKMSRRITRNDHLEILLQMQIYGWLFEQTFQIGASSLEVLAGTGDKVVVPYDGPDPVIGALRAVVSIRKLDSEPFSPVGTSKCGGCGFHDYCWNRAEATQAVALVPGVDQGLAITLNEQGVLTIDQLLETFDESSLSELQRLQGRKLRRVGSRALSILRNAKALTSGTEILLCKPEIPRFKNYVMFDLEGLPPQLDELQKIYLWGMQAFGESPGDYIASTAGFGSDGDRQGWEDFLANAASIFEAYGDIPFVHWATYEGTFIKEYLKRYGDVTGQARRVQRNLLNLLPVTERSVVLPLSSYSLKTVEKYVGFERTQDEYGGTWSMAKYIEATETQDEATRAEVMDAIRTYNREDLAATWCVLQWLLEKAM